MTTWNPELYDARHSLVWQKGADLLELLKPQAGERILDLGCGTGHLTAQIAASGAGAVGMDSSPAMLDEARKHHPSLQFELADAREFSFKDPFDAVFSNAALHWVKEADHVARCVQKALKPGGRFVAELGGKGNVRRLVQAFYRALDAVGASFEEDPNPWYFPSIGEYTLLLERYGLETAEAKLFGRPTILEDGENGLRNWIRMFGGQFLAAMPAGKHNVFVEKVESLLRPELFRNGAWIADYRRLRIVAYKMS